MFERVIKEFLKGTVNSFIYVNKKEAEQVLETIFEKVEKNIKLEENEEEFLKIYLLEYYPRHVGGDLYPYPKYDEKLKPIYKRIADYYIIHQNKNTYESAVFLQYYFLVQMAKDYKITPFIGVGDEEFFSKNPTTNAYHKKEQISKTTSRPIICYNPEYIKRCVERNQISILINTGFHELEHEVQDIEMQKSKVDNPQAIIWAKECVTRNVVGEVFYDKNYKQYFLERDARHCAIKRTEKLLKDLGCEQYLIQFPDRLKGNDKYDTTIIFKDVENQDDEMLAIDLLESICTNYMKIYYSILLKEYPVLTTIYDEKGNKKVLSQIQSELEERKQKEIEKNPKQEQEIIRKYNIMLYEICRTDNDLKMQYMCLDAAFLEEEGDEQALKTRMSQITKLSSGRNVSYESFIKRINARLNRLEIEIHKNNDYNSPERNKLVEAEKNTLELKRCVLKYNTEFNEKYTKENIKNQIKQNLERKLERKIEPYKWLIGTEGYVVAQEKTKEELDEQYKEHVKILITKATTREELDKYLGQLTTAYDDLYKQMEESKKVPNR